MKNSLLKRILVFITVSSIIAQSFSPYVAILSQRAYAQEVTDQSTTTETQATTVEQVTPAPENTNPTPSEEQVTPTEEVTPAPTDTPTEVTPTEVNNNSPPAENTSENQGIDISITPTETPVTITPTQEGLTTATENPKDEQLNLVLLDNVSAPSIDLNAVEKSGSAVLTTDKPDYAPTDTALITGSNLLPNTTYTLRVWSDDEPPTGVTAGVSSDENGVFAYAYQLDGTYRPNYSAELRDLSGNIVATVTFTDSHVATHECQNDVQGADDEPGQKDLTKMCVDNSNLPTSVNADWNWDDTGWSGANTGDACALFDTDGDGLANFASCVTVEKDPATQKSTSPRIFTCNDTRNDRCAGPSLVAGPYTSSCSVNILADQPFVTGDDTPNDTQASCTVQMSEVGGSGVADLVDVCSFPSDNPNSDPSDCIVFEPGTGRLEVIKDLIPSNDSGLFNLQINATNYATNVGDAGTTGEQVFTVGNNGTTFAVGETAGTNTNLANYTSSIVCKNLNGTGSIVAQSSNAGPLNVLLDEDEDIICTITNTRQTATITVNKTLSPSNDPGLFNLQVDGNTAGTGANVGNGGTTGAITVNTTGTHTISETEGTNTSLSNYTTTWVCNNNTNGNGTSAGPFSLTSNQNLVCTFTNTRNTGSVLVNKLVDTNGDGTYDGGNTEANNLGFSWSLDTLGTNNFGSTVSSINTGSHNVNENLNNQPYHFVGWYLTSDTSKTCANTTNTTLPANISVTSGQTTAITLCNARNTGTVTVYKDVQGPNGENILDTSNNFTVQLDGSGSQSITDNGSVTYNNVPTGNHTVTESLVALGYTLYGISETQGAVGTPAGLSITVSTGATTNVYVTNRQNPATITVVKIVKDASGQTVSDHHTFTVQLNGGNDDSTLADNNNVVYSNITPGGPYTVSEVTDSNYDNLGCKLASGAAATGFNVTPGQQVTVTCTNQQKPGSISGYKFQSDGTTPIANWGITLFKCTTSDFLTCVQSATTTTNANGLYSFINLVTGFYKVVEDFVDGFTPVSVTSHNVTINPNTQSENNNFSNFKNINITVCKEDSNQNRISGWEMTLNVDNVASGSAKQTDINGCYTFTNLGPNHSYSVTEENRSGWTPVLDPNFTHDFGQPVDGQNITYTFVNVQLGTIIVKKVMVGGTESFDFTGDVAGTISVNNGTLSTSNVLPGDYTSTEGTKSDWTLDSIVCNDTTNGGTASTGDTGTRTATFNVDAGETVTCTFTNSRDTGTLRVLKNVDLNADGDYDDENETGATNWEWQANGGSDHNTGDQAITVNTGDYTLTETKQPDFHFVSLSCEGGSLNTQTNTVTVIKDANVVCTFTNARDTGTIEIVKNTIGGDNTFGFAIEGLTSSTPSITTTNGTGTTGSETVAAGTYSVSETDIPNGWSAVSLTCEKNNEQNVNSSVFTVSGGDNIVCTATNKRDTGRIIVRKLIDEDGNLNTTNDRSAGENWEFDINGTSNDTSNPSVSPTDSNGETSSGDINTGEYTVKETIKDGYRILSASCEERQAEEFSENGAVTQGTFDDKDSITGINVFLDTTVICEFVNTLTLPKLVISKSNNAVGNKSPNDIVGFTITIAAEETGGAADNVKVVDLLPKGFVFNSSSWKVVSSDTSRGDNGDITSLLTTPTYASPGTWNLGHLNSGETLTLTYNATIDGAQQTGTYYDNAWGQGNPVAGSDVIFARAIDPGDLDAADPSEFVGTQVSIINSNQPGVDYNATSTKEVLGASTYLPATGENTLWVIIATLLFGLGLGTTLTGIRLRKKYE